MSVEEKNNKRTFNRRGFMAVGGAFALAGLGLGTGALWSQRDTITDAIVSSGNLDISQGLKTAYITNTPNPSTNAGASPFSFFKMESGDPHSSIASSYGTPSWIIDYDFAAEGDNLEATVQPQIEINEDVMLPFKSPDDTRSDDEFLGSLSINAFITPRIEHADLVEQNYDFSNGVKILMNDQPVLYQNLTGRATYESIVESGEIPDLEENTFKNNILIPGAGLSYEDATGEDVDELDPDGTLRVFSGNVIGSVGGTNVVSSFNLPKGSSEISMILTLSTGFDNLDFKDSVIELNDCISVRFETKQIRRGL